MTAVPQIQMLTRRLTTLSSSYPARRRMTIESREYGKLTSIPFHHRSCCSRAGCSRGEALASRRVRRSAAGGWLNQRALF